MSFCSVPPSLAWHALLLGRGDVHGPDDGRRAVDGHAGRHLVERDAVEEDLHVGQAADGHAALAELAQCLRRVRVVAHQCRQVECHREAHVALAQQVLVAGVGLLGAAEPGKHAHRPRLAAVERRVDTASIGVLAGITEVLHVIKIGHVERGVEPPDGFARSGHKGFFAFGGAGQSVLQRRLFPAVASFSQLGQLGFIIHWPSPVSRLLWSARLIQRIMRMCPVLYPSVETCQV